MAKCTRCGKRKAKRFCPALGQSICSLCCGQLREKELHCPPNCPHLSKHRPYQEKRIIEKRHIPYPRQTFEEEDILKDERMAWLAFHIEAPLKEYAEKNPSLNDKDALLELEYVRSKIEKDKGLILMPEKSLKPQDELGEAIYQMIEQCKYEGRIIVTGKSQTYSKEEKLKVLDKIIGTVKYFARGNLEGRSYLQAVKERFSKIQDKSQQKKVLTIP
jgi:hypothetical protein